MLKLTKLKTQENRRLYQLIDLAQNCLGPTQHSKADFNSTKLPNAVQQAAKDNTSLTWTHSQPITPSKAALLMSICVIQVDEKFSFSKHLQTWS